MSNDAILMITFGEVCGGLENFTISGKNWIKLKKWIEAEGIDSFTGLDNIDWFYVAYNITPKQTEKFADYCDYEEAKKYMIDYLGKGVYEEYMMREAKYHEKQIRDKVLEEMDVEKWNPRSVGGKLDFDRRAKEDGIVWDEE